MGNKTFPFFIHLEVITPVGDFFGYASGEIDTYEEAVAERDNIQEVLKNGCGLFTFFNEDLTTEISMLASTIQNSVFQFMIIQPNKTGDEILSDRA